MLAMIPAGGSPQLTAPLVCLPVSLPILELELWVRAIASAVIMCAAAMVTAAAVLTATVVWRPGWLLDLVVVELPPGEQQVQGGEVLDRVVAYGGWAVAVVSVFLTLAALMDTALAAYAFFTRRNRWVVNRWVATARRNAAGSLLVTVTALFVLSIAIGSIEWVAP